MAEATLALERGEGLLDLGQLLPDHLLVPNPAPGAGAIFPLDSRWTWRFRSARFVLTSSAAAANRFVTVDYCDPEGNAWIRCPAPAVQVAAVAQEYDFAKRNVSLSGIAGQPVFTDLDQSFVPGGWQIRINVGAIDVADQLSAIRLYVEKFEPYS
jgi:hypothetical protein